MIVARPSADGLGPRLAPNRPVWGRMRIYIEKPTAAAMGLRPTCSRIKYKLAHTLAMMLRISVSSKLFR